MDRQQFTAHIRNQLLHLGLDPGTEVVRRTPDRAFESFKELTQFHRSPDELAKHFVFFEHTSSKQLIVVSRIFFSSLCEHHLLPFFGCIDIGYIPDKKILGLSKFKRIVELFTKQITLQERLNQGLFTLFWDKLAPCALIIQIEAKHTCALTRGAKDTQSTLRTLIKSDHFTTHREDIDTFFHMTHHETQ